jgi:hypothetical protein
MKFKQHIEMGKSILSSLNQQEVSNFGINRVAYLLGNVAPDLNCIYPAHRLSTTEKRFYKRLKLLNNAESKLLKSFELGIVTHYICDYFCCAHNNKSSGIKHKKYETNLYSYYDKHRDNLGENNKELVQAWTRNKIKNITNIIDNNTITAKNLSKLILEQVKQMNNNYTKYSEINKDKGWENKVKQMQKDMEYTIFMTRHITRMIIEPTTCFNAWL